MEYSDKRLTLIRKILSLRVLFSPISLGEKSTKQSHDCLRLPRRFASRNDNSTSLVLTSILIGMALTGCTVKAVGDPNRPITINAHITLDIKGLKDTATDIEDYVSGGKPKESLTTK